MPLRNAFADLNIEPTQVQVRDALLEMKRGVTDWETRLDYGARTDGQPEYVGKNANGADTSAPTWVVQKLSYSGGNLVRVQVLTGSWDGRAALAW